MKKKLNLQKRTKRGIANFIGRGINYVTGNLDDNDKKELEGKINSINQINDEFIKNQQQTLDILDNNNEKLKILREMVIKNKQNINKFNLENRELHILIEFFNEYRTHLDNEIEKIIENNIDYEHIEKVLKINDNTTVENLELLETHILSDRKKLILAITFPDISEKNTYETNHLIVLPKHIKDNIYQVLKGEYNVELKNTNNTIFTTVQELGECKKIRDKRICPANRFNIISEKRDIIQQMEERIMEINTPNIYHNTETNTYSLIVNKSTTLIIQTDQSSNNIINKPGLLWVEKRCLIKLGKINRYTEIKSTKIVEYIQNNYNYSSIEMEDDIPIPKMLLEDNGLHIKTLKHQLNKIKEEKLQLRLTKAFGISTITIIGIIVGAILVIIRQKQHVIFNLDRDVQAH